MFSSNRNTQVFRLNRLARLALSLVLGGLAFVVNAATPVILPKGFNTAQNIQKAVNGNTMTITQKVARGVINWSSFNIGAGDTVKFAQPSQAAAILNRIAASGGKSNIDGALTANGNVFLMNPAGIVFGSGAQVNVHGLLATTFNIPEQQFLNGKVTVNTPNTKGILNKGTITLGSDGFLYLVAPTVDNEGTVKANVGTVTLGNAGNYDVSLGNSNTISFVVPHAAIPSAVSVTNGSGAAIDNAKTILLSSSQAAGVTSSVVNSGGLHAADSLTLEGGTVSSASTLSAKNVTVSASDQAGSSSAPIKTDATKALTFDVGSADVSGNFIDQINGDKPILNAETGGAPLTVEFTHTKSGNTVVDSELAYRPPSGTQSYGVLQTVLNKPFSTALNFTQKAGGVDLTRVKTSGNLSVTAHGQITDQVDNANISADRTDIWANNLTLTTTAPGASIGVRGYGFSTPQLSNDIPANYLNVNLQGSLNATADNSDIFVQSTAGNLTVGHIDTGTIPKNPSKNNQNRVMLQAFLRAEQGSIVQGNSSDFIHAGGGVGTTGTDGGAVTLFAHKAIGTASHPVLLQAGALQADTEDGAIFLNNQTTHGLSITHVIARQKFTINTGSQTGVTAFKSGQINASGQYLLPNGASGTHDVSITSTGGILLAGGNIRATRDTSLRSKQGSIAVLSSQSQAPLLGGRHVTLNAAGSIGLSGMPITLVTERVDATAGENIFLKASSNLIVGWLTAGGNVGLEANQGAIALGTQENLKNTDYKKGIGVTVAGTLTATADNGSIVGGCGASTSPCGNPVVVKANAATFVAKTGIGSSGNPIKTDVGTLSTDITATPSANNYATYVDNGGVLNTINVTTPGDTVQVANLGGDSIFSFSGAAANLGVNPTNNGNTDFNLSFADTSGQNLAVGNISLSGKTVTLSEGGQGSLTAKAGGSITAATAVLSAGGAIGTSANPLLTQVATLSATAPDGIFLTNKGSGGLTLQNAQATGSSADVDIQTGGSLTLLAQNAALTAQSIAAGHQLSLAAGGAITMPDGSANRLAAAKLVLSATSIGTSAHPVRSGINGAVNAIASSGGVFVNNTGSVSQLAVQAPNKTGNIQFTNTGDVTIGTVASLSGVSGGDVTLNVTGGSVMGSSGTSQSGPTIKATSLAITASSIGAGQTASGSSSANLVLVNAATITQLAASGGGINVLDLYDGANTATPAVSLESGSTLGGPLNFTADSTIDVGILKATGESVTLTSEYGSILDGRTSSATKPNITAFMADLTAGSKAGSAQNIGSKADPLALKVSEFSGVAHNGNVHTQNSGPLAVTASTLTGKGPDQNVSISGSSITVLPMGSSLSQPITLSAGDNLDLTATDGNIVFLNPLDTIQAQGKKVNGTYQGGNMTLTAKAGESVASAYNGNIILGNLVSSNGGNINIDAARNVTLQLLKTAATPSGTGGNITVQAQNGVILDGNGAKLNLIGNHVILAANAPSARDAELARDNAIATAKSLASAAYVLQTTLTTGSTLVSADQTLLGLDQAELNTAKDKFNSQKATVASLKTQVNVKNGILFGLQDALSVAQLAIDIADIPESVPEGVPLTGDGGAAVVRATESIVVGGLSIAVNVASQAASVLDSKLSSASGKLDRYAARVQSDNRNLVQDNALLNAAKTNNALVTLRYNTTLHSSQAAAALQQQSIDASGRGQNLNVAARGIESSASTPLGVEANKLDVGATLKNGQVSGTLNSGIYVSSPTALGLGAINVAGNLIAQAQGNLGLGVGGSQIQAAGDIGATSSAGNISVSGPLDAAGNITANADKGDITVGAPVSAGGNFVAAALNSITLGKGNYPLHAGGGISATSQQGNILVEGPAVAGGNIALTADSGDINVTGPLNAGSNIVADAHDNLGLGSGHGQIQATGNITASAQQGNITVTGPAVAGADIAATAHNGSIMVTGPVTAGGSLVADAYGNVGLGLGGSQVKAGTNIAATSETGNILVQGPISAAGNIEATAAKGTIGGGGTLSANSLAAVAGNGVGTSAQPLHTYVRNLAVDAGNGPVHVINNANVQPQTLDVTEVDGVSGIQGNGGISLSQTGNLALFQPIADSNLATSDAVDLTVHSGGIQNDNGSAVNVQSASLNVSSDQGVSLDTLIGTGTINVNRGGNIAVRQLQTKDVYFASLTTPDGSIQASGGGNIELGTVHAGAVNGSGGDISVDAGGAITNDGNANTTIRGTNLTLDAKGGGIGSVPATFSGGLDTAVDSLQATASGPITIRQTGALVLTSVDTSLGNVTIKNDAGALTLGQLTDGAQGGNITLDAAAQIDRLAHSGVNLSADRLALQGGAGVGSANAPLIFKASRVGADGGTGGVFLTAPSGDVQVGGVTPNFSLFTLNGIEAAGPVSALAQAGSLTVADPVLSSGGDVLLTAYGDQTVGANVTGGNVTLTAHNGALDMTDSGSVDARGDLNATAAGDVTVSTASAANNATIKSANGAVIARPLSGTAVNVSAKNLLLTAQHNIGSATVPLRTHVDSASATINGTGSLYLAELDSLNLGPISINQGNAVVSAGANILVGNVSAAAGNVQLTSQNGAVTSLSGEKVTAQALNVNASGLIDLTSDIHTASLNSSNGAISLADVGSIDRIDATGPGSVSVTAPGDIGVGTVTSGGATSLDSSGGSITAVDSASKITAPDIRLQAQNDIGSKALPLSVDPPQITADSTAGSIYLNGAGPIDWRSVLALMGNIELSNAGGDATIGEIESGGTTHITSTGSLTEDGVSSPLVSAQQLSLAAGAGGIGPLQISAPVVDATVGGSGTSVQGGIVLRDGVGVKAFTASTQNGDVALVVPNGDLGVDTVTAPGHTVQLIARGGHIGDASGGGLNVASSDLGMQAASGIGSPSEPLHTAVSVLAADGGNGGVFIDNESGALTLGTVDGLSGLTSGQGDLFLANTGSLLLSSNVSGTGHITLVSGGDLTQSGSIQTQGSSILVDAAGTLTTEAGASTVLGQGQIGYAAGQRLVLAGVMAANTTNDGVIVLKAPDLSLVGNQPHMLSAEAILVDVPNLDQRTFHKLLRFTEGRATLERVNAKLVKSPDFWTMACSGEHAGSSSEAGTGNVSSCTAQ